MTLKSIKYEYILWPRNDIVYPQNEQIRPSKIILPIHCSLKIYNIFLINYLGTFACSQEL